MTEVKIVVAGGGSDHNSPCGLEGDHGVCRDRPQGDKTARGGGRLSDPPHPARHGKGKVFVYAAEVEKWMQKRGGKKEGRKNPHKTAYSR